MCLSIKGSTTPLIAKKDIKVYKRLERHHDKYETPFQGIKVTIGSRGTRMKAELAISYASRSVYKGIHAHTSKNFAIARSRNIDHNGLVVEAIIPKGAKYLLGSYKDIVATEMKLSKIIFKSY